MEHNEARSLIIDDIDFNTIKDGDYYGRYEGGMCKWRENECLVTVLSGKVEENYWKVLKAVPGSLQMSYIEG